MSGTSTSLRFPGQLNGDLRKLGVNLIPVRPSFPPSPLTADHTMSVVLVPASALPRAQLLSLRLEGESGVSEHERRRTHTSVRPLLLHLPLFLN